MRQGAAPGAWRLEVSAWLTSKKVMTCGPLIEASTRISFTDSVRSFVDMRRVSTFFIA